VFASMAFWRKVFEESAAAHPGVAADNAYVDAMALNLVMKPWTYDVMVTENMFGEILSELTAALVGGMGMAPSGDIGDKHGLFQPAHGTAPDIAGQGKANPTAMLLSAAMMLDWLADRSGDTRLADGAAMIERAVEQVFATGSVRPMEFGGPHGAADVTRAVVDALKAKAAVCGHGIHPVHRHDTPTQPHCGGGRGLLQPVPSGGLGWHRRCGAGGPL